MLVLIKVMMEIHKTVEFEARISERFDIFAPNLASQLYTKLLGS